MSNNVKQRTSQANNQIQPSNTNPINANYDISNGIENINSNLPSQSNKVDCPQEREPKKNLQSGGNIKVLCRFRPFNDKEKENSNEVVVQFTDENNLAINQKSNSKDDEVRDSLKFSFDHVFKLDTPQVDVYEIAARPLVEMVLEGYNGTILAYGQTSSGKTYTMQGNIEDNDYQGIIPRMIKQVFTHIYETTDDHIEYTVKVSIIEIYMEKIKDLLEPTKNNLKVREDKIKGIYIEDLSERYVVNDKEVLELIEIGTANRAVAYTNMNSNSSRSHLVFILTIHQKNTNDLSSKIGKLYLVDLAGSEKMGKTGATGQTLEEGKMINLSLTTLGMVINSLTDPKCKHVPYRDSVLTRVLSESLGGNSKTHLIITCSPSVYNESETISTLRFGMRAKKIVNKAKINKEETLTELRIKISNLELQIKEKDDIIKVLQTGKNVGNINNQINPDLNEGLKPIHNRNDSFLRDMNELMQMEKEEQNEKQLSILNEKINDLDKENQLIREEYEKKIIKLKQKNYERKNKLNDIEIAKNILEEEIDRIQDENKLLMSEKDELLSKKDNIINHMKLEIDPKVRLINDLNLTIKNYLQQINEKDNKLKQKEEIIIELKSKLEDYGQNKTSAPQDKNSPFVIIQEFVERISKQDDEVLKKIRVHIDSLKSKLNGLQKNNTIESEQQTDEMKFSNEKLKISNFNLDLLPIQLKNVNIVNNDKEILAKQNIIFHQMMRQKAVFEIEKLILDNKLKKRHEKIAELEKENKECKESLRLVEEKTRILEKVRSPVSNSNVVRIINKHNKNRSIFEKIPVNTEISFS